MRAVDGVHIKGVTIFQDDDIFLAGGGSGRAAPVELQMTSPGWGLDDSLFLESE